MKRVLFSLSLIIALTIQLTMLSCKKETDNILPGDPVPIDLTIEQASLIASENSFAFEMFKNIVINEDVSENIIFSPLSISTALSMTVNGANGSTLDSILKALMVTGISPADINISYRDLTRTLLKVDRQVKISIANSVWTEKNFLVKAPFIEVLTNYYDSESKSFDINDSNAPEAMNKWIEDNINGLIKDMIEKLDDNTVMLLINAIYFKGQWRTKFDVSATQDRNFYKADGTSTISKFMNQTTDHKVYSGNGFVMAELPYGQGNFVMDILIPDENNGISGLLNLLSNQNFSDWNNNLNIRKTNIYLPKFKYDFKKSLKSPLSAMGMGIAFTEFADFTKISEDLLINDVMHQAFIETNEEGTEAAAATVVEIGVTSIGPDNVLLIDLNHPFLYIIRETSTNTILFMGRLSDPIKE